VPRPSSADVAPSATTRDAPPSSIYVVRLELNDEWREVRACAEHVFGLGNQLLDEADSSVRLEVVRE